MMKPCLAAAAASLSAGSTSLAAPPGHALPGSHRIVTPGDIVWGPAPPSLRPGAKVAILYGDPSKDGLFAMRLKAPKGFRIAPHTHRRPEIVTVISGTVRLGLGTRMDAVHARPLTAGSFFSTEPGTPHYAVFDEDTVLQVNSSGPWTLTYVDPRDDPRTGPHTGPRTGPRAEATPGACQMQGGHRLRVSPLRAVGTEPFWSARIEGRCVTYSTPEDRNGTRVWTRLTQGSDGDSWSGALGGRTFELRTRTRSCSDGMSDRKYPLAVELRVHGQIRKGCAEPA